MGRRGDHALLRRTGVAPHWRWCCVAQALCGEDSATRARARAACLCYSTACGIHPRCMTTLPSDVRWYSGHTSLYYQQDTPIYLHASTHVSRRQTSLWRTVTVTVSIECGGGGGGRRRRGTGAARETSQSPIDDPAVISLVRTYYVLEPKLCTQYSYAPEIWTRHFDDAEVNSPIKTLFGRRNPAVLPPAVLCLFPKPK